VPTVRALRKKLNST